jgi:hypothetical protein
MDLARSGRGGGGGGRRGGGGSGSPASTAEFTRGATSALLAALGEKGLTPDEAYPLVALAEEQMRKSGASENQTLADTIAGTSVVPEEVDSNDSWFNPRDWFTGPETIQERQVIAPEFAQTQAPTEVGDPAAAALDEARAAIAAGAPVDAVKARLEEMGIDTSGL